VIGDEDRTPRTDARKEAAFPLVPAVALTVSFVAALAALAACGRQAPAPATEQPDPPSWFVGEEDRTTPTPRPERVASLAVGDSAFEPAKLAISGGEAVRIKNTGTGVHSVILAGIDMAIDVAIVEPGASKVVPIDLEPGGYSFSLRDDPSITGTLIVT
jgi:plastocyanin